MTCQKGDNIHMELAPILLFTYNRPELTKKTIHALQQNVLAGESELFIFSDGPKDEGDFNQVRAVRNYIKTIGGFKKIEVYESAKNNGLANSIIAGVSQTINQHGRVIVLEDDLITSKIFLSYINQALNYYGDNPQIFSISGYSSVMEGLTEKDVYFTRRASSWGWATWKQQWDKVDWDVSDYQIFVRDRAARSKFNRMGSDMAVMLDRQMRGEINSWAIRWCYCQFRNSLYTVYPGISKISNIGFGAEATHTRDRFNRFKTILDTSDNTVFGFNDYIATDERFIRQFTRPFSISERIKYKLLNALPKF
jgi:hypothetical protein